jgi:hypothetical protein
LERLDQRWDGSVVVLRAVVATVVLLAACTACASSGGGRVAAGSIAGRYACLQLGQVGAPDSGFTPTTERPPGGDVEGSDVGELTNAPLPDLTIDDDGGYGFDGDRGSLRLEGDDGSIVFTDGPFAERRWVGTYTPRGEELEGGGHATFDTITLRAADEVAVGSSREEAFCNRAGQEADRGDGHQVTYDVSGEGIAEVIWAGPDGIRTESTSLPAHVEETLSEGVMPQVRVVADDPDAPLSCSVTVDGEQIDEQSGTGTTTCRTDPLPD